MKLSTLQENLNSALSNVSRFCTGRSQLPILSNVLFSAENGRLKLSATNLEIGINYWLGSHIDEEGSITVPSKEITEFISYLPSGKLDLCLKDNSLLSVSSPKAESTFATIPSADFPPIPSLDPDSAFELDFPMLSQSVSQVAFAAATDDTRPVLTSVYWRFTQNDFIMAATDGFRLSIKNIKLVNPVKLANNLSEITFLIPARTLQEVTRLSKNAKTVKIGLTRDQHQVVFVLDDFELTSRLIEGEFPPYERIIPQSSGTTITLNKEEFAQAVKIASVFARESANVVKFIVKDSSLILTANASQLGHNQSTVDAKVDGNQLEIAFNYKFVSEFLGAVKGEDIQIELNESLTPGIFRDLKDPTFTHIIMPVRLQD